MTDYDMTILIVNYNTAHLLNEMFTTLYASLGTATKARVVVIDNASTDNSVEVLKTQYPEVMLIENQTNVGFGRANNQGLPHVEGRYVLLLNTDAFVAPDTLTKTLAYMDAHSQCGVLGVRLVGRDGKLQPSCRYFATAWSIFLLRTGLARFFKNVRMVDDMTWDHASARECDWVPGCYFLIRREAVDRVGLFDPRYFLYSEEVDLCHAVKNAGWQVVYFPDTTVVHIGGESAKSLGKMSDVGQQIKPLQMESEWLYFRKHHGLSGLMWHVVLTLLADLIVMGKLVVKTRRLQWIGSTLRQLGLRLALLMRTRLGSVPTR